MGNIYNLEIVLSLLEQNYCDRFALKKYRNPKKEDCKKRNCHNKLEQMVAIYIVIIK